MSPRTGGVRGCGDLEGGGPLCRPSLERREPVGGARTLRGWRPGSLRPCGAARGRRTESCPKDSWGVDAPGSPQRLVLRDHGRRWRHGARGEAGKAVRPCLIASPKPRQEALVLQDGSHCQLNNFERREYCVIIYSVPLKETLALSFSPYVSTGGMHGRNPCGIHRFSLPGLPSLFTSEPHCPESPLGSDVAASSPASPVSPRLMTRALSPLSSAYLPAAAQGCRTSASLVRHDILSSSTQNNGRTLEGLQPGGHAL